MAITQKRLKEILRYDPNTGNFICLVRRGGRCMVGAKAGTKNKAGYIVIVADGEYYKAHRLAWMYVFGRWPSGELDHRDTIKSNNRIDNLREASRSQNSANRGAPKNNQQRRKGVGFNKRYKRWSARICFDGKSRWLGTFPDADQASMAYARAATELFGSFARSD